MTTDRPMKFRVHHYKQEWFKPPALRRWQRFHFFWPHGRKWRGAGVTIWAHEFSIGFGPQHFGGSDD